MRLRLGVAVVLAAVSSACGAPLAAASATAPTAVEAAVREAALQGNLDVLRARGPAVLPQLVSLYRESGPHERAAVARAFYGLGWKSEEAKQVLLGDLATQDVELRLDVQWALGRVSADPVVVDRLFANMENDPNLMFRDKSACALANDQIHLDPRARLAMMRRVVERLESPDPETRSLAVRILHAWTGQAKGFLPGAPPEHRAAAVERWRAWLVEYERSM
jgi:hypothetical protein